MGEPSHIFVYGTLRAMSAHPMARRLQSQARLVGKGRAPGRLYDMSWYPAAFFDERETYSVLGDVFALKPGARLLAELDAYESGNPNFLRSPLRVRLFDEREVVAWAYGFARPPNARLIRSGDFMSHRTAKRRRPVGP